MASLVDLFNPSFFMFLGVLVLVVAGLVVYFESKLREQNLRIASMLSLMSTLVEDVNGVKYGVHQLSTRGGMPAVPATLEKVAENENAHLIDRENVGKHALKTLIEVSDDECNEVEDSEIEDSEVEDSEVEDSVENEDAEDSELEEVSGDETDHSSGERDVKIITIHNFAPPSTDDEDVSGDPYEEANQMEFDPVDDLNEFLMNDNDDVPDITDDYVEQVLDLKYDEDVIADANDASNNVETSAVLSATDLKTISINAADEQEPIDYRKIQLSKLKTIAIEKGLATASEASKLKKPDILKLLGIE